MTPVITVAIVEDDPVVCASWGKIIQTMPGYSCTGRYGSAEEALAALPELKPDFVLMDINLPGMSGIDCTKALKKRLPQTEVIMLTMFADGDNLFESLRAGACGYLLKRTTPAALKQALDDARGGGSPMSPQIARHVITFFHCQTASPQPPAGMDALTERENEILRLLSEGQAYKNIADRLRISVDTVRTHIRRIYQKLEVHSRTEAVVKFLGQRS